MKIARKLYTLPRSDTRTLPPKLVSESPPLQQANARFSTPVRTSSVAGSAMGDGVRSGDVRLKPGFAC